MTSKKTDEEIARLALSAYVSRLRKLLSEPDCPVAVMSEARKFFEGQGIALETPTGQSGKTAEARNRLREKLDQLKRSG